jgi:replicative DNA helicase
MAQLTDDWLQAQYSVLGSVLISPELTAKVVHETSERDYMGTCLTVYKSIRKLFLAGIPVDPVSLIGDLGPDYRKFVIDLMAITPTAANIDRYIHLCREQARIAAVQDLARQMAEETDGEKQRQLLEEASGLMVAKTSLKITTMADALRSFMDRHTK